MALVQAEMVRNLLLEKHPFLQKEGAIEIVPIRTSGDWRPEHRETTFLETGGNKGFFTKEIEDALSDGAIDLAVHSMKDMPTELPQGLEISSILEREDVRDAFISQLAPSVDELPAGARVGTSSLRRSVQILARRPDLKIVPLRGNVETRLKKLGDGIAEATILAAAGLRRLGIEGKAASFMETDVMLPAVAQGALGVETRQNDEKTKELVNAIGCAATFTRVAAERAALRVLDGSCRTPVAVLATLSEDGGTMAIDALAAMPDGSRLTRRKRECPTALGLETATALAAEIKARIQMADA